MKPTPIFNADAPTLVLAYRRDYFDDVDILTLLAKRICYLDLLPICTTSACIIVIKQAVLRQCQMPYAVCMY
jgi:hypothetical protein